MVFVRNPVRRRPHQGAMDDMAGMMACVMLLFLALCWIREGFREFGRAFVERDRQAGFPRGKGKGEGREGKKGYPKINKPPEKGTNKNKTKREVWALGSGRREEGGTEITLGFLVRVRVRVFG